MTEEIERESKGTWIPNLIWRNKELTCTEKCLLAEIDNLDKKDGCFASNEYLARNINLSEHRVSEIISKLKSQGHITQETFNGRKRVLRSNYKYTKVDLTKTSRQTSDECQGCLDENVKHIIKINNKDDTDTVDSDQKTTETDPKAILQAANTQKVLDYWNSLSGLPHHRQSYFEEGHSGKTLFKTLASKLIEQNGLDAVLKTIKTYHEIAISEEYWWTHIFTLADFLRRGYDKFADETVAKSNYKQKQTKFSKKQDEVVADFSKGEF